MQKITDRTIVKACVLTAILCLIFGICFKYRYRLKDPVFVEQSTVIPVYYEETGERTGFYADVRYHYITGKEDVRLVQYIEFPELNQTAYMGGETSYGSRETKHAVLMEPAETLEVRGEYVIHTISGRIYLSSTMKSGEKRVVTGGRVVFTDGCKKEVTLGNQVLTMEAVENRAAVAASASVETILKPPETIKSPQDRKPANYFDIWKYLNRRGVFENGVQK